MSLVCQTCVRLAWLLILNGAMACMPVPARAAMTTAPGEPASTYWDVLPMRGVPYSADDRGFNVFFDTGAWQGYSLPHAGDVTTGFSGPFVHSLGQGRWTGLRFAGLQLRDAAKRTDIILLTADGHAAPGYLLRQFQAPGLRVSERLMFADSWHAVVRIGLVSTHDRVLDLSVLGHLLPGGSGRLEVHGQRVVHVLDTSGQRLVTEVRMDGGTVGRAQADATGYRIALARPVHLRAHREQVLHVVQTLIQFPRKTAVPELDPQAAWAANRRRWQGYLAAAERAHLSELPDALARRVAVKAVETLIGNWRAARGDLHHDGVVPSYSNPDFNGFWAWDSWKHAAALAGFAPSLAENQIRAMFDYQAANGMVPDCIFRDHHLNNWRDSKPPLAAWAVWQVYRATHDRAFVAEMYPRLLRYHRWWWQNRDHDHDGLAEYGSTDGSKVAARWESGMDNAVRFDSIHMLKNHADAWSMDQASVDLNAYLYREARTLVRMAGLLHRPRDARRLKQQATAIGKAVRERMFDASAGWFFDVRLADDTPVKVFGAEGWIPLWAGLATPAQAHSVERGMLDPDKFDTFMPLPTLARDDPRFSPVKGYWRGPIWMDQALFGVQALRRYGYWRKANLLARRLVMNAQGLVRQASMRENYDPLTGKGEQSRNFSWTAAAYWMLLHHAEADSAAP